jgi:hypothetical protein
MKGIDPFTKAEKTFFDVIPSPGDMLMRVDRARFAAFPRTEWTFHGEGKDARLTVFYLGVPDTTPEFADEAKLEAYLGKRLNSAR